MVKTVFEAFEDAVLQEINARKRLDSASKEYQAARARRRMAHAAILLYRDEQLEDRADCPIPSAEDVKK